MARVERWAEKKLKEEDKLKSYPIVKCRSCGTNEEPYMCEQGHNRFFCKTCLMDTEKREHGTYFKAHCILDHCNFVPLTSGKAWMKQ